VSDLRRAEHAPELLDEETHDAAELAQSLDHVAAVNRWLGGTRALLKHVTPLLHERHTTRILDLGTGSADLPRSIVDWARKNNKQVEIVATDLHPQMRAIAAAKCAAYPEISVQPANALDLSFEDKSFDISTLSLTLHHFEAVQQIAALTEMKRITRTRLIVNELARTRINYIGAKLLATTYWRGNRLTRHDGPLSVRRAFTKHELQQIARDAGMSGQVHSHFFQRLVLVCAPTL
jgi:ubiquinone/menaquinone biosynthesis C-methylase UbiE